jgi:hypothetical protein
MTRPQVRSIVGREITNKTISNRKALYYLEGRWKWKSTT